MTSISWILLLCAVLTGTTAQLLLKAGTNAIGHFAFTAENVAPIAWRLATQPYVIGGITIYSVSAVLWILTLSRAELSVAYPIVSLGYLLTAIASWYFLGEHLTPMRLVGIAIIVIGVYFVARSA